MTVTIPIPELVVFGVLAVVAALVLYGTLTKNRWGINVGDLYCPRCKTPPPRGRPPQSVRQEIWGGWTCPVCGAEVDKWGRELSDSGKPCPKVPGAPGEAEQIPQAAAGTTFFGQFKGRPVTLTILLLFVLFDVWSDFNDPGSIVLDVITVAIIVIWYRGSRRRNVRT
jgi:hypothetical protein